MGFTSRRAGHADSSLPAVCPDVSSRLAQALTLSASGFEAELVTDMPGVSGESLTSHSRERALEEAVRRCVRELRSDGWPPERVLVAVKRAALHTLELTHAESARSVRESLVRWMLDEYYGPA